MGWDVQHVADIGMASGTDAAIMDEAKQERRVVVTLDHDMPRLLHLTGASGPSVLLFRLEGLDRRATVAWIVRVVPQVEADLASGAVVSVSHDGARVRSLPIG